MDKGYREGCWICVGRFSLFFYPMVTNELILNSSRWRARNRIPHEAVRYGMRTLLIMFFNDYQNVVMSIIYIRIKCVFIYIIHIYIYMYTCICVCAGVVAIRGQLYLFLGWLMITIHLSLEGLSHLAEFLDLDTMAAAKSRIAAGQLIRLCFVRAKTPNLKKQPYTIVNIVILLTWYDMWYYTDMVHI